VPDAMRAYRRGPPPAITSTIPQPPLLKPGVESVWLRWFDHAACIECVPAPAGSHLVVFRFSRFAPRSWQRRETGDVFAALDKQLADWLPGKLSEAVLQWRQ
jgi:hypothetical protein